MDIELVQGAATLRLNGSGVSGAFRAARFADEDLRELEVMLEGPAGELSEALSTLNAWLYEAQRSAGAAGENWVYLRVTLADGSAWRTPLLGGRAAAARGPAGRALKAQGLRLEVERGDFWETDRLRAIQLSNVHASGASVPLYNHADAGHQNSCTLEALEGDLPAPLVLETSLLAAANNEAFLGLASYADLAHLQMTFEAEASAPGAGVSGVTWPDTACSSGGYDARSWSGSGAVTLADWSPVQAVVSAFAGRFYRPLVRLQSLAGAGEKFWMQVKLAYQNAGGLEVVYETEPALLPVDRLLAPLPPVQLPPWPTLDADSQPVGLLLSAQAEAGGSHQLKLDYLGLIPMDSYLQLVPRVATYPDFVIQYDSEKRLLKNNGRSMGTHLAEGDGLWAAPRQANRLYVLSRTGSGCAIDQVMAVSLGYRPRRRSL